jgi:hypothetical protein
MSEHSIHEICDTVEVVVAFIVLGFILNNR